MNHAKYTGSLAVFEKYRWLLRSLGAKSAERERILSQIDGGLYSRDTLYPEWFAQLEREIETLRRRMHAIEKGIDDMPDDREYLPCKLFLRLHFLFGYTITETAMRMNVSESTVRRVRDRAARYFELHAIDEEDPGE